VTRADAPQPPGGGGRFLAGDPIRGLTAFAVFNLHAALAALVFTGHGGLVGLGAADLTSAFGPVLGAVLATGTAALPVFFVLSGYLLSRPFLRRLIADGSRVRLRRYLVNRFRRIVPAYWAMLTIVVVVALARSEPVGGVFALALFDVEPDNPLGWWIGQAWTLEVEAKFYLALPLAAGLLGLAMTRLGKRPRAVLIAAACLAALVAVPLIDPTGPGMQRSLLSQLPFFCVGILLATVEVRWARLAWGRDRLRIAGMVAAVVAVAILALRPLLAGLIDSPAAAELIRRCAIGAVVAGPLLYEWAGGGSWRLLDNRPLNWLGTRSYSFYLVHVLWINQLASTTLNVGDGYKLALLLIYPVALIGSLTSAEILFRLVERPLMRGRSGTEAVPLPPLPVPAPSPALGTAS
jgi:peptidoglycan/LPS O-acetylase OafA/YrhL